MAKSQKVAVLASGGIDSSVLIHLLSKKYGEVFPVYVESGHIWERAELRALKHYLKAVASKKLKPLSILSVPTQDLYWNHWSQTGKNTPDERSRDEEVYLPGKNLLLISKAIVFCSLRGISELALGPLKTNPFPDASSQFFKKIAEAAGIALNQKFWIHTPLLKYTKSEVVKLGKNLPLELTFSCLNPKGNRHCRTCNKCAERKNAFL